MATGPQRLNVTLDADTAAKLRLMAQRTRVNEGTLARSLLSAAIDDADADAAHVAALLDGLPGAFERTQTGLAQAAAGETVSLDEL